MGFWSGLKKVGKAVGGVALDVATGGLGSAALSVAGGMIQDRSNKAESQRNRGFQENMRNTQWQSTVADMEAAGINPALALSQGPNASPGGSMAAGAPNLGELGVNSARASKAQLASLKLVKAQTDAANASAMKLQSEGQLAINEKIMSSGRLSFYFNPDGTPKPQLRKLMDAELGQSVANSGRSVAEMNLARLRGPEQEAIAKLFRQAGESGKGIQLMMPLLLQLMRGGGR